ncbi:MAG: hypothetical protein WCX46_04255 [Candidatus Paceibacterota bacterium]
MKISWFYKWFVLNNKERRFLSFMEMLEEKYSYVCMIKGKELSLKEFIEFYHK